MGFGHSPTAEEQPYELKLYTELVARRAPEMARRNENLGACSTSAVPMAASVPSPVPSAIKSPESTSTNTMESATASTGSSKQTSITACPTKLGGPFDYVVAADVLEHTIAPESLIVGDRVETCAARAPPRQRPKLRPLVSREPGWRLDASTTTSVGCSIEVMCASSRGAASNGCSTTVASRSSHGRSSAHRSQKSWNVGTNRRGVASSEPQRRWITERHASGRRCSGTSSSTFSGQGLSDRARSGSHRRHRLSELVSSDCLTTSAGVVGLVRKVE